jgi:hypothetical protein
MEMTRSTPRRTAAVALAVVLIGGIAYSKPWVREVWITTTPDAFASDGQRAPPGQLFVHPTPAPWPEEVKDIWRAAKWGRTVHVSMVLNCGTVRFDIVGVTQGQYLVVDERSMTHPARVRSALGGRADAPCSSKPADTIGMER